MKIIFWLSFLIIGWSFFGYPLVLILINFVNRRARVSSSPNKLISDDDLPFVSFIVAAHNEEKIIGKKIENIVSLDYPKEKQALAQVHQSNLKTNIQFLRFALKHLITKGGS